MSYRRRTTVRRVRSAGLSVIPRIPIAACSGASYLQAAWTNATVRRFVIAVIAAGGRSPQAFDFHLRWLQSEGHQCRPPETNPDKRATLEGRCFTYDPRGGVRPRRTR